MNFTQLHCFVKAVDNSSFTIAAEALNFTQPAVSKNIKDLENELEVTLIVREHHRISLTDAGKYFYKVARNVVDDMDYAKKYLRSNKSKLGHSLRIGVCDIPIEEDLMPIVLHELHKIDSKFDIRFMDVLNYSISEILNYHVDICLVSRDSVEAISNINFEPLIEGHFVVMCPANSFLSEKEKITLKDLQKKNLFLFNPTNSLSFQTQNKLIANMNVQHIRFVSDFFKMGIYVKADWGYGILPNFIADYHANNVKYVPLDYPEIPPYGIAYMKSAVRDIDIEKVIQVFKSAVKKTI